MDKYHFEIKGTRPLLMHWDNLRWQDEQRKRATKALRGAAGDDRSTLGMWQSFIYAVAHKGGARCVMPGENVDAALREAGKQLKDGRRSLKAAVLSGVQCSEEHLAFYAAAPGQSLQPVDLAEKDLWTPYDQGSPHPALTLYLKRVRVNSARHVRVRPRFDAWAVEGVLLVARLSEDHIRQLFALAGSEIGLGDWRPRFGRFELTGVEKE